MEGRKVISLTGENSHKLSIEGGQGSFAIGIDGVDNPKKWDILANKDLAINWNAFDEFYTGAGSHWPRYFYYHGDDIGFINWSEKRQIEQFNWQPTKSVNIDLKKAQISDFHIKIESDVQVKLCIWDNMRNLSIGGHIENIDINFLSNKTMLSLSPFTQKGDMPYELQSINSPEVVESLTVNMPVAEQPFDCKSLIQFTNLKSLSLYGNITNTAHLSELDKLQRLAVRFTPDLGGFPSLNSWKNLESFIGWNIEENVGKRLKTELKKLQSESYSNVSQLRKKNWFITEYNLPFASWNEGNAKSATKSYKQALKQTKKAKTKDEIKEAIQGFIASINLLSGIETTEREDAFIATDQLAKASKIDVDSKLINKWFDEYRDF